MTMRVGRLFSWDGILARRLGFGLRLESYLRG